MSDAFAELNEHNDAGTPLALGAPGVFAKWVSTNIGLAGPSDFLIPSTALDGITVGVNGGGIYNVTISVSFGSDKVNSLTECSLFVDNVEMPNIGFHRTIGNANDQGAASGNGLIALSPGNVLDLRFNSSVNNTTLDLYHITLVVKSILRAL